MLMKKHIPMILIGTLIFIACALMAMLRISPPMPRQHLVLDELGCIAATRLGQDVAWINEGKSCEVVAGMDFDFNWVRIGTLSISRAHVIASRVVP